MHSFFCPVSGRPLELKDCRYRRRFGAFIDIRCPECDANVERSGGIIFLIGLGVALIGPIIMAFEEEAMVVSAGLCVVGLMRLVRQFRISRHQKKLGTDLHHRSATPAAIQPNWDRETILLRLVSIASVSIILSASIFTNDWPVTALMLVCMYSSIMCIIRGISVAKEGLIKDEWCIVIGIACIALLFLIFR